MLGILCLFSCLGAVLCGGVGLSEQLLSVGSPLAYHEGVPTRTSIAFGNSAFLARYGYGTVGVGAVDARTAAVGVAPAVGIAPGAVGYAAAPAAVGYAAAPAAVGYATAPAAVGYAAAPAAVGYAAAPAAVGYAAAPAFGIAAAPAAVGIARTAAIAAPAVATVTAAPLVASAPVVSSVHHVPAVAQVPVTKYEAQPALVQNVVDIAKPKIASRKFEIRRPAIQKDFYDIEERIVVRPAGSAVVELDQPISKTQRGPTVVSPATPIAGHVRALPLVAHPAVSGHLHTLPFPYPIEGPVGVTPAPQPISSTPRPDLSDFAQLDDSDSVSVENPEVARARISQQQQTEQQIGNLRGQLQQLIEQQSRQQAESRAQQEFQARARLQEQQRIIERQQIVDQQQQQQLQARFRAQQEQPRPQPVAPAPVREVEVRSRAGQALEQQQQQQQIGGGSLLARTSFQGQEIPSFRNLPEVEQANQARLIALLTERGPVSEVRSAEGLADGRLRARVLSATPAPLDIGAQDEKVNTRRVVVNRPIQTVQEVDVVQPFTKIDRVAVHQPALIKTARFGVANVHTSVPVQTFSHAHYAI